MPRKQKLKPQDEPFGRRLARLRKAAGYSQRALATEVGISQRMVAYYERQTDHPPTTLLPLLAQALQVSADELLGIKALSSEKKLMDRRLWQRFRKLEKLPPAKRRVVVQVLDAFLEQERTGHKVAS